MTGLPKQRGGEPRLDVVFSEAWRNLVTGTSRGLLLALAFFCFCGGTAVAQSRIVVDFTNQALAFRASGAAIWVISQPGGINGQQCDNLAAAPGILAAGAIRPGPPLALAVLPSGPINSWQVTPGFTRLLNPSGPPNASGVWLASDLADRAVVLSSTTSLGLTDGTNMAVAGVYDWPTDGRLPILAYSIVAPVTSTQPYDQCWVLAWPQPEQATQVLSLPLLPTVTGAGVTPAAPTSAQLNQTLGTRFDGPARFASLPILPLELACIVVATILGFASIRLRRLELAANLHLGVARSTINLQVLIETTIWALLAALPASAVCLFAAKLGNTANCWAALYPGIRSLVLAIIGAALGALISAVLTRENHLFHYFKQR